MIRISSKSFLVKTSDKTIMLNRTRKTLVLFLYIAHIMKKLSLILSPGIITLIYLWWVIETNDVAPFTFVKMPLGILILFLPPIALALFLAQFIFSANYKKYINLAICTIAPIALMFPWAVVPGKFGFAPQGPPFFLSWLTKYPDFGAVNLEVLAGIGALMTAGFLPVIFTLMVLRNSGFVTLIFLLGIMLLAYAPVLIVLDLVMWLFMILGPTASSLTSFGPLLRLLAVLSMAILTWQTYKQRESTKNVIEKTTNAPLNAN